MSIVAISLGVMPYTPPKGTPVPRVKEVEPIGWQEAVVKKSIMKDEARKREMLVIKALSSGEQSTIQVALATGLSIGAAAAALTRLARIGYAKKEQSYKATYWELICA